MVRMPRKRPKDKFSTSQEHPGRLGRFMWKFKFKGQNVRGTHGTYDGTDGICPRDRRGTHQGVSCQNSLCLLLFVFSRPSPHFWTCKLSLFAHFNVLAVWALWATTKSKRCIFILGRISSAIFLAKKKPDWLAYDMDTFCPGAAWYHPGRKYYQCNSENKFFGTVTPYQPPNNSRSQIFRYR